jgi:hypothetical protein
MHKLKQAIAFLVFTLVAACSGPSGTEPPIYHAPQGGPAPVVLQPGSLDILIQGSTTLSSLNYSISNGGPTLTGTIPIGNPAMIEFSVSNIPDGSNYVISLTAVDAAMFNCSGASGPVTVSADATTNVTINLVCLTDGSVLAPAPMAGAISATVDVSLDGSANNTQCPYVSGITATPQDVAPNASGTIAVTSVGIPPAVVVWSTTVLTTISGNPSPYATGGFPLSGTASQPFTCPGPTNWTGSVQLTATVTEPTGCPTTGSGTSTSVVITCE